MVRRLLHRIKRLMRAIWWFISPAAKRHARVGPWRVWRTKRDFQIQFLRRMGLRPESFLLDIGCGTLRGGLPIIEYLQPSHYYGIEVREDVLEEGKKELMEANLLEKQAVLILSDDLSALEIPRSFDFVWAFSVLFHMTDEILEEAMRFVTSQLKPGGHFFANVNIGEQPAGTWEQFPVVHRELASYGELGKRCGLNVEDMGELQSLGYPPRVQGARQHMLKLQR
jgi:SAM-dependent methyltransferase